MAAPAPVTRWSYNRYLAWHAAHGGGFPQVGSRALAGVLAYLAFERFPDYRDRDSVDLRDEENVHDAP